MTGDGDRERIRCAVERLQQRAAGEVAKRSGARGFSILAGFPLGECARRLGRVTLTRAVPVRRAAPPPGLPR